MVARGYRRSGPPSGRASTTTAASPKRTQLSLWSLRVSATPCCDDRLSSGGGLVAVLLCAWDGVSAGDRAGVCGGCRVQDDRDDGDAGSRDDRAVCGAARGGDRWDEDGGQRQSRVDPRLGQIAREIVAEARAVDEAEDELYGDQRGDELPEQLRTREGRAEFFRQARERRAAETPDDQQQGTEPEPVSAQEDRFGFDTERIVARHEGHEGWTREAHRQLEQYRWKQGDPVPRGREDRLLLAGERLEAERDAQIAANRAYEEYRENGRDTHGRRLGRRPKPWVALALPEGVVSVSDPDTQRMKANREYVQGYNAQAVVDEGQIVVAAEITNTPGDFSNLDPMICAALSELERAGVAERPEVALADAGYWNEQHMDEVIATKHIQVLIPRAQPGERSRGRAGPAGGTR